MAKTLLQITQGILSDMGGDQINSIFDTEEAEAVARHVVNVYENMVASNNWAQQRNLKHMVSVSDNTKPNYLLLPEDTKEVIKINFDKKKDGETQDKFVEVEYKHPEHFIHYLNKRNNTDSNVQEVVDFGGVTLYIRNDIAPSYYTSFDDEYVVFDAYDSDVSDTLQGSQAQVVSWYLPELSLLDDAVPTLPKSGERLLIEEATVRAQAKENEYQDIESIQAAQVQRTNMARRNWRVNTNQRWPNYGR